MRDKLYNSDIKRSEKQKAISMMIDEWQNYKDGLLTDKENKDKYIHVGVFNPSTTCLDLDLLVERNLIREDTKLIFFENKKYLNNKDKSEYVFKQKVRKHIPMVNEKNFFFHFGELETLQLGGVLRQLNAEYVDFIFLDLCGELKYNHLKWVYDNRYCIMENSFQFYTVSLMPGILHVKDEEKFAQMKKVQEVFGFVHSKDEAMKLGKNDYYDLVLLQDGEKQNRDSKNLRIVTDYWNFICSHTLDTRWDVKHLSSLPVFVYQGGKVAERGSMKMGIFSSQCHINTIEDYRWQSNSCWIKNFNKAHFENIVDENGVSWNPKMAGNENRKFGEADVILFRDFPVDFNVSNHNYQHMLDYILRSKSPRRFETCRIWTCAEAAFPTCFPPEMRSNRYRSSYLPNRKAEGLLKVFMVDKVFEDAVTKQKYRFIRHENGKYDLVLEN